MYRIIILLLISHTVSADLFKCRDENDNVIFTDQPCRFSGDTFQPKPIMTKYKSVSINKSKKSNNVQQGTKPNSCAFISSTELRNLRVKQEYKIGIPKGEISKRFGHPDEISTSGKLNETWIYKNKKFKLVFKFKDGCLSNWKQKWFGKKNRIDKYRDF